VFKLNKYGDRSHVSEDASINIIKYISIFRINSKLVQMHEKTNVYLILRGTTIYTFTKTAHQLCCTFKNVSRRSFESSDVCIYIYIYTHTLYKNAI